MGQKVNPISFRTGITEQWKYCWFAKDDDTYGNMVGISAKIKSYINNFYKEKNITKIRIEFNFNIIIILIRCQNISLIIGEKGKKINLLTSNLEKIFKCQVQINAEKEDQKTLGASSLCVSLTNQINNRVLYKKAIKQALSTASNLRYPGIKIIIKGRLGGAEIARREKFTSGKIPAHTLRANIDYNCCAIETIYGTLGLKIWIYKNDVYEKPKILLTTKENNVFNNSNKMNKNNRYVTAK